MFNQAMERTQQALQKVLILLIRGYQLMISPYVGRACRFEPSCSQYSLEALGVFGFKQGFRLMVKRICRCHPWCAGGLDPVPNHQQGEKA